MAFPDKRILLSILASAAVHAAVLAIPLGAPVPRPPEPMELEVVIEAAAVGTPLPEAAPSAAPPAPKAPEPEPRIAAWTRPAAEPIMRRSTSRAAVRPAAVTHAAEPAEPAPPADSPPTAEADAAPQMEAASRPAEAGGGAPPSPAAAAGPPTAAAAAAGRGAEGLWAAFGASGGPAFVKRVLPRYPRAAREMGRQGVVVLRLTIDAQGVLTAAEVAESAGFGFDEEALAAVRASTFRPAMRDGRPIESRALLPVKFVLKGAGDD